MKKFNGVHKVLVLVFALAMMMPIGVNLGFAEGCVVCQMPCQWEGGNNGGSTGPGGGLGGPGGGPPGNSGGPGGGNPGSGDCPGTCCVYENADGTFDDNIGECVRAGQQCNNDFCLAMREKSLSSGGPSHLCPSDVGMI